MRVNYDSVLLITASQELEDRFRRVCGEKGIKIDVEHLWCNYFCYAPQKRIYCDEYFADKLTEGFAEKTTLILREYSYEKYKECGYRFIFNADNVDEIRYGLEYEEDEVTITSTDTRTNLKRENTLNHIIYSTSKPVYAYREYYFDFRNDIYTYKGDDIFFTTAQKLYLSEWLLCGIKDKKRRAQLYSMRLKFGKDFLKDAMFGEKLLREPQSETVS